MTSSAVLDPHDICICGEPCFRHRLPNGSQISCDALRCIDQALKANGQPSAQTLGQSKVVVGGRDRDDAVVVGVE